MGAAPPPGIPRGGVHRRPLITRLAFLLLLATAVHPGAARGQARDADGVTLVGRVIDQTTGAALAAAFVTAPGFGLVTLTGEDGVFTLGPVPEGPLVVGVERFGYEGASFDAHARPGLPPILELSPLPVVVDGVTVTVDRLARAEGRLESRMRSIPFRVLTFDARSLAEAPSSDPLVSLSRAGVPVSVCPSDLSPYGCIWQRGGFGPVRVYLDEMPLSGGADHLAMIPTSSLHRIEVVPRLGQIRAYTRRYVEWMAAGNRVPAPILWW